MTNDRLTTFEFADLRQNYPGDVRVPVRWLDQQLPDPDAQREYARDRCIVVVTEAIGEAIERSGLTRSQIAKKLGVTKGYVSQVLSGPQNITLKTLGDLMWACDVELHDLETSALGVVMATPESAAEWARGGSAEASYESPFGEIVIRGVLASDSPSRDVANGNLALAA